MSTEATTTTSTSTDGDKKAGSLLTTTTTSAQGGAGDSNTVPGWLGKELPDELKTESQTLSRFKTPQDLAKSYLHLNKKRNEQLQVPGADAKPEDWESFFGKIGRPEAADKYEIKGEGIDTEFLKQFKGAFHKAGLLPQQAQAIVDAYQEQGKALLAARESAQSAEVEKLKTEWGSNFDKKLAMAQKGLKQFATPEEIKYIDQSGLGNDPGLIRLFEKVGASLAEDPIDGNGGGSLGLTPEAAQKEIQQIRANPVFWDKSKNVGEHQLLVQRLSELHDFLYPEKS